MICFKEIENFGSQIVEVYPVSFQDVRIAVDEIPEEISGFDITISFLGRAYSSGGACRLIILRIPAPEFASKY
jgi:hypothetical protein